MLWGLVRYRDYSRPSIQPLTRRFVNGLPVAMKQSAMGADEEAQSGRILLGALDRMVDQLCQLLGRDAQRTGRGAGISGPGAQSVLRRLGGGGVRRSCHSGVHVLGIARVRPASVSPARPTLHGEARSRATPRRAQSAHQHTALRHHDRSAGNLGAAWARASDRGRRPFSLRALCRIQLFRPRSRAKRRRPSSPPIQCAAGR